ncbi:aminotransferase class V-fold PLP-dependent enzyme [Planococcus salinus]|uniref:Aminotransferase class V-fold PLP-dependent enzyme n=1 Tax=Planococcus salinus TaxID=1848460 RepID=A0A3M8P5U6_9BACL|nr:aminotransferase class V-fold PLP-dependent enzyme [Planococcus salinus]RNF39035.1 aminotransferase class V-fold PLP-dependent enzyme [Planococcus salinus]
MTSAEHFRKEFPIFQSKIQLSSCSQSAMHFSVKNAVNAYLESWEEKGMDWHNWMAACENARKLFARQINAAVDEIAIVSSVSHAASAISTSLQPADGRNRIVVTEFDFPTIGHVWRSAEPQFTVEFFEKNEQGINDCSDYEQHLPDDLLLFSTSHVNFYNGYKQDLQRISDMVHRKGGYVFIDAYQSFGQTPIDVKEMDVDFLAAGMQKYGFGIPGIAFLYAKKDIVEDLTPRITGWFGQANPFAFDIRGNDYAPATKRFDSGTFPMINGFAAEAALTLMHQLDMPTVERHLEKLSTVAAQEIEQAGLINRSPFAAQEKGSTTAVYAENASEVEKLMAAKGIIVSARNDVIRIAPHYYNTSEDIRTAVNELKKSVKKGSTTS